MDRLYPKKEIHNHGKGKLALCDCLNALDAFKEFKGMVSMAYVDIPHNLNFNYTFTQKVGESGWQNNQNNNITSSFKYGPDTSYESFLKTLFENIKEMLLEDGCIYIHTDAYNASTIRMLLDNIFNKSNFVNEIIWNHSVGGSTKNHFSRKHDNIFLYKKGKTFYFDPDAIGTPRGKAVGHHRKKNVDEAGKVYYTTITNGKEYRYYEDDKVYIGDVWNDIPSLIQNESEHTGYETQRPEELLKRMILSSSKPKNYILDFTSGSGTTLAVATQYGRIPLCCDINPTAINLGRRRGVLNKGSFVIDLNNMPMGDRAAHSFTYDGQKVILSMFMTGNMEKYTEHSLLSQDDIAVDFWSVGYIRDDAFYVYAANMRTTQNPSLKKSLPLPKSEGVPTVQIVDVFGDVHFIKL